MDDQERKEVPYSLCEDYISLASNMRRHFTLMESYFGFAQVAFEDVLYGRATPHSVEHHLRNSRANALQVITIADSLESKMRKSNDLFVLSTIDLDALGQIFISNSVVNARAWKQATTNARLGGFHKNLSLIRSTTVLVIDRIGNLSKRMNRLRENKEELLNEQLCETNLPGSLGVSFAQLKTLLSGFQSTFIASLILSTEIYHHFYGNPPLVEEITITSAVQAS